MLNDKRVTFILSLVLAVALWMYVVGQLNPEIKKTYRSIPVTLTNEQTLNDNGLAIKSVSDESMRVTVSGRRDAVSNLTKTDIVATVDLTDAAEGQNKLPINIKIPEDIEIDNQSLDSLNVDCETVVTKEKKVAVSYTGSLTETGEATTVKLDPEKVTVKGAESVVNKVHHVKCEVPYDELEPSLISTTAKMTAVDEDGKQVDNVTLSIENCKVTAMFSSIKEVPLETPVKGLKNGPYKRTVSAPKEVMIKGTPEDLEKVSGIKTRAYDVSRIKKDRKVRLKPVLPKGVSLSRENPEIIMEIEVKKSK